MRAFQRIEPFHETINGLLHDVRKCIAIFKETHRTYDTFASEHLKHQHTSPMFRPYFSVLEFRCSKSMHYFSFV